MREYRIYEQARGGLSEVGAVRADTSWAAIQLGKRLTKHPITVPSEEDYGRLRITPMDLAATHRRPAASGQEDR